MKSLNCQKQVSVPELGQQPVLHLRISSLQLHLAHRVRLQMLRLHRSPGNGALLQGTSVESEFHLKTAEPYRAAHRQKYVPADVYEKTVGALVLAGGDNNAVA
ncbi:hypothetical protein D3C74_411230 [compost metagenome]